MRFWDFGRVVISLSILVQLVGCASEEKRLLDRFFRDVERCGQLDSTRPGVKHARQCGAQELVKFAGFDERNFEAWRGIEFLSFYEYGSADAVPPVDSDEILRTDETRWSGVVVRRVFRRDREKGTQVMTATFDQWPFQVSAQGVDSRPPPDFGLKVGVLD